LVERDVNLLLSLRGIRSFAYGFVNTSLGFYLSSLGYREVTIGLLITAAGFFSAFLIILSGILSDKLGSRKLFLIISSALMAFLGFDYALFHSFPFSWLEHCLVVLAQQGEEDLEVDLSGQLSRLF